MCWHHPYKREIPDIDTFILPAWGSNWGNRNLLGVYVVNIYCGLSVKTNMPEKLHGERD